MELATHKALAAANAVFEPERPRPGGLLIDVIISLAIWAAVCGLGYLVWSVFFLSLML